MVGITSTGESPSVMPIMFIAALSMFFSVYMMSLIHQFSVDQNDSLKHAFALTLSKVVPVTVTGFVFGLAAVLVIIPAAFVATLLGSGIADETMRNIFIMVIIAIPLSVVMYRCFFAPYLTLVDGLSPIDAIKASNRQVKGNRTIFYGFTLLSFVVLAYVIVLAVLKLIIAVNPMALGVAEFALNVVFMPFFSVFIYRLFSVTKIQVEEASEDNEKQ